MTLLDCKLILVEFVAVTNGLMPLARSQILERTDVGQGRQNSVVKAARRDDVGNSDADVVNDSLRILGLGKSRCVHIVIDRNLQS